MEYNLDSKKRMKKIMHFTSEKIDGVRDVQRVITGWRFPNNQAEDAYLSALLSMRNPTQAQADYLKRQFQVPIRRTVDRSTSDKIVRNNKIVEMNSAFTLKKPTWKEISSFYGSPLALMKDGINQTNFLQEFELNATLESVEFINSKECLMKVKLSTRNKKGKEFHKLPKMTYNYKGTYKVNLSFDDILKGEKPPIKAKFVNKKYLPKEEFEIPVDNFIDVNYEGYRKELLDLSRSKITAYKNLVQYSEEDLNISCKCLNDMDYYSNNTESCEKSLTNSLGFDWQSVNLTTDERAAAIVENLTKNCKN